MAEQSEVFVAGVEAMRLPGLEQTGQLDQGLVGVLRGTGKLQAQGVNAFDDAFGLGTASVVDREFFEACTRVRVLMSAHRSLQTAETMTVGMAEEPL